MSRGLLVVAVLSFAAGSLGAQSGREHFVQPDTALDPIHATQQDAFLVLRDSTASISAAGSRLMSDLTSSSSLAWMQARARSVTQSCARSVGPLAGARRVTAESSWPLEIQQKAQANLLKAMATFAGELSACQKRWSALSADTSQVSLRENAPHQMNRLEDQVNQFNRSAQLYLQYISITLPPPGSPIP